jgi:hypothetical protein
MAVLVSGGFRSVKFCQVSSWAEAACLSKPGAATRSWVGLQPGFILFPLTSLPPWLSDKEGGAVRAPADIHQLL